MENRPWGDFEVLEHTDNRWVKRITIKPLQRFSLQSHEQRDEYWILVQGEGVVTLDNDKFVLTRENGVFIPATTKHRLYNISKDVDLIVIEVAIGDCQETDIIRYQDDYQRVTNGK